MAIVLQVFERSEDGRFEGIVVVKLVKGLE
jgi:hypothetical protein